MERMSIGMMDIQCEHCDSLFFEWELLASATRAKPAFGAKCCRNGKIKFPQVDVPSLPANGEPPNMATVLTPITTIGATFQCVQFSTLG